MMQSIATLDPGGCPCAMQDGCLCNAEERVLRLCKAGKMQPLTPDQREECLREIGSVEGYDRKDYESLPDADVASGVLHAWADFCRDKGLL